MSLKQLQSQLVFRILWKCPFTWLTQFSLLVNSSASFWTLNWYLSCLMAFLKLNRMGSSKIFSTIFLLECSFLLLESIFKDFQKRSIKLSCFLETNKIKCLWKVDIFVCGLKSIFENKYSFISYLKVTFLYLSLVLSLSPSYP